MRPRTWADKSLNPPPWSPLVGEVEALAGRVMVEGRVSLVEMREALKDANLTSAEERLVESLIRSYAGGVALEQRRRMDKLKEDSKRKK